MRRHFSITGVLLVALFVAGCGLFGGQPVTIQGYVTIDGAAPEGVEIEVIAVGTKYKSTVKPDGQFEMEVPSGASYTLEAVGNGITRVSVAVRVPKGEPVTGITLEAKYLPETPLTLNLDDPFHRSLILKPWESLNFAVQDDPFGQKAIYFPLGDDTQLPPQGYDKIRFALLDLPEMDTFKFSLESLGGEDGSQGNRTLTFIFGFEDLDNWWMAHVTNATTSRVAQMKDGKQITPYTCHPGVADIWVADTKAYQKAEVQLSRDDGDMVLNVWVDGKLSALSDCRFPASDYTPGQIGFGGSSNNANQSWYIRNLHVDTL